MCRLAAFPPDFPRLKALEILLNFEGGNVDGTGSAYLSGGEFIVDKWPKSLGWVLKNRPFLTHMPHPGWTICHLRAASHGGLRKTNTHPFVIDNKWAICHNGIWSDHSVVRLALSQFCSFRGETDSEVAAQLINIVGPKRFTDEVGYSGVFLGLTRHGDLWAIKTSGELSIFERKNETAVLASELDSRYKSAVEVERGWYHFNKNGHYKSHYKKKESVSITSMGWGKPKGYVHV